MPPVVVTHDTFVQLGVQFPLVSHVSENQGLQLRSDIQLHHVPVHATVSVTIVSVAVIVLDEDVLHVPYVVVHSIGTKSPHHQPQIAPQQ